MLWLVPTVEKFPRSQKFLLGDRIQSTALDVLERLIEATYTRGRQPMRVVLSFAFGSPRLRVPSKAPPLANWVPGGHSMATTRSERRDAVITHVGLSEARTRLGAVIERVRAGKEYVVLEKAGKPVAALMDIEEFEDLLELRDPEVQRIIEESREDELAGRVRPARELLAELYAEEEEEKTVEGNRLV
ncbi:MAG: type II toxin-antitoxin system prevent-host-death family antitoxin [Geminicoccaceae bacterium]